ncbi:MULTISPECIES: hypothetical protein [unclassified Pseudomonas]|uniref:Uncharacterized protein n=1 Tax=Pseudomonas sp. MYb327 TaxID=2745230 RepID=A0AAU8E9G1_9PSED
MNRKPDWNNTLFMADEEQNAAPFRATFWRKIYAIETLAKPFRLLER